MNDQDIRAKARAIITDAVNGVLMTVDGNGFPHPRTMWTAGIDDDFTTYFVTGRQLAKVAQIEANNKVCMFWSRTSDGDYTFLKGEARVTDDQALRDRFWNDHLSEHFPQGKTDPSYVVIVVKPKELMLMDGMKYPLDKIEL